MASDSEVWITDRPVTDGPGTYAIVVIGNGIPRRVVATAERDDAMRIVAMREALAEAIPYINDMAVQHGGSWAWDARRLLERIGKLGVVAKARR